MEINIFLNVFVLNDCPRASSFIFGGVENINIYWVFATYFALYLVSWQVLFLLILRITLWGKYNSLHFSDYETEAQKDSVICSKSFA